LGGRPSACHLRSATANASWTASSPSGTFSFGARFGRCRRVTSLRTALVQIDSRAGGTVARGRPSLIVYQPVGIRMARRAAEHPVVRQRLLDAARELFLRDGFAATGVAEI